MTHPSSSHTCLVRGGMSGWTPARGLWGLMSAARRVLLLGLRASDSGFSIVRGSQPRLWPGLDGSVGLADLEHRWQALWSHQCSRLRAQARTGRRRVEVALPAVPAAVGAVTTTARVHL